VPPRRPSLVRELFGRRNGPLVALLIVLLLVLAVILLRPTNNADNAQAPARTPAAGARPAQQAIQAQVSSVDPVGGSGFRREGDRWRTQSYGSAEFGNLKDGVGLLLDLGSPRAVTDVTLDVQGPVDIELRAGDQAVQDGTSFDQVAAKPGADGATKLDGTKGGKHRYWLVWVTKLANDGGGYSAVLGQPKVSGPAH
jgi:hypothetical protein